MNAIILKKQIFAMTKCWIWTVYFPRRKEKPNFAIHNLKSPSRTFKNTLTENITPTPYMRTKVTDLQPPSIETSANYRWISREFWHCSEMVLKMSKTLKNHWGLHALPTNKTGTVISCGQIHIEGHNVKDTFTMKHFRTSVGRPLRHS